MSPRARIVTDNICQNGFGTSVAHIKASAHEKAATNRKQLTKLKT